MPFCPFYPGSRERSLSRRRWESRSGGSLNEPMSRRIGFITGAAPTWRPYRGIGGGSRRLFPWLFHGFPGSFEFGPSSFPRQFARPPPSFIYNYIGWHLIIRNLCFVTSLRAAFGTFLEIYIEPAHSIFSFTHPIPGYYKVTRKFTLLRSFSPCKDNACIFARSNDLSAR